MNEKLPRHVAIIMDGNGRWAQQRGLPRIAGHQAGVKTVREIVEAAIELGIPVLTLYAFSRENWKRPKKEIEFLMNLLNYFLDKEIKDLRKEGVAFRTIGRIEELPAQNLEKINQAVEATRENRRLILNIALNYGSRQEILDAVNAIAARAASAAHSNGGGHAVDEKTFSDCLYTAGLPDPDLLIRTSGEMRLSNFLLWQLSYAEIYITKKFWPDFHAADFRQAVEEFSRRERRFGDVHA